MPAIRYKLHKFQYRAIHSPKRFVCMLSGIQGGKTTGGAIWLSKEVLARGKDKDYLVVSPTFRIAEQSTIKKFHEWFPKNWGHWVQREKIFKLKEGGVIYFRSADEPRSLEGVTAAACWMDEAGQVSRLTWETVRARVSILKGRVFLTTTPYVMNWLFHDFYKKFEEGHPDYDVIQFASNASPWFPQEEYEAVAKTLDPRRFKLKYKGEFTQFEGMVYSTFNRSIHVIKPYKVPKDAHVLLGVDYGFKNPSALIWAFKDKEGALVIFREFYKNNRTVKDLAPHMKLHNPKAIYVDPSAKTFIMELKNVYTISNIMPADNDVSNGISRVQALFNLNKIKIFSSCSNLIDELESYHYKENRDGMLIDAVVKRDDHACDALRYLVNTGVARPSLSVTPRRIPMMSSSDQEWGYGN